MWPGTADIRSTYALSGSSLAQEATNNLLAPTHQWPLTDGDNATAATDTSGGTAAQLSPAGATWTTDDFLDRPVVSLDGSSGYLTLPNQRQWHTVTLTADGYDQSLFLDDDLRIGMAGSPLVKNADPQNYVGAGVFPANSSTKKWTKAPGDTTKTRASYFTGNIANDVYYNQFLTPPEVAPYNVPAPITGAITSELSNGLCPTRPRSGTSTPTASSGTPTPASAWPTRPRPSRTAPN